MKEKQYIRFVELSGICITRKEFEGVKLFMEIEELIQETEKALTGIKTLMLVNKWASPYVACTELVKRIETNEMFIKNICKASGTTLTKIGYKTKAKEARELLQVQTNENL